MLKVSDERRGRFHVWGGRNYGKFAALEEWQAREAEAQALRDAALAYARHVMECLKAEDAAHAALAGSETGGKGE